ncbi:hypothetical protein HPP92_023609 [Vanilla planifolia]|uniref:Uncharacterized protein n=1 Tax=Vanilla planifolia TaxID=51239 RepID=A0A835PIR1_VANPL|nr:hypothetical protein HPP92_023918 [Vanilla planifolia]KAG0455821.1 hypothetical protein HPP92_023609 [Vanilla planifolia]
MSGGQATELRAREDENVMDEFEGYAGYLKGGFGWMAHHRNWFFRWLMETKMKPRKRWEDEIRGGWFNK